jgi:DNA-binding MarR family transcriptional regulator
MMFLTAKQRVLVVLYEEGPLQNSHIARKVGITEQYCSQTIKILCEEGLVETEFIHPRRISRLTAKGIEIARCLKQAASLNVSQM